MKEVLAAAGVPTARFGVFAEPVPARSFLRDLPGPWVVKTDGLASGKGVLVTGSRAEAEADIEAKLSGQSFGEAGRRVVVEEGLSGVECSLLVLCDGHRLAPLAPAQDFKRLADGDTGPNTGGMGAYSPVPFVDGATCAELVDLSVAPLLAELRRRGIDYRGVLYAGLMLTDDGPRVLEFNVRFGDPESQVVLPRLAGDLTALLAEVAAGALATEPAVTDEAAVCVVMAAAGYPGSPRRGDPISGLGEASALEGVTVFHAGTAPQGDHLVTAGGRVLGVTGLGPSLEEARRRAYQGVDAIGWDGAQLPDGHRPRHAGFGDHGRPMIPRYAPAAMAALFTDEARLAGWLEVELLATEGWAAIGEVPQDAAEACRSRAPVVDAAFVEAVAERERETDHDVAAFVDVVQAAIGQPEGSWIHYGLTSSDVVDTALCATLTRAADQLVAAYAPAGAGVQGAGARRDRHAGRGSHPRHARRAHHLRSEVRPLGPAGRPRPAAARSGPRPGGGGQALRRGGHLLEHRSSGRGSRVPSPGPHPGAGQPGGGPRPPRRVPVGLRLGRRHCRGHCHRGPAPGPQRDR